MYKRIFGVLCSAIISTTTLYAQAPTAPLDSVSLEEVAQIITDSQPLQLHIGKCRALKHYYRGDTLFIELNEQASYIPFRTQRVRNIYDSLTELYGRHGHTPKKICVRTNDYNIEDLIPVAFGGERQRGRWSDLTTGNNRQRPLVTPVAPIHTPSAALQGRHLALWRSHGYFYDNKSKRWRWQRPLMNGTIEDLLSFSYMIPYVVPMLENSGAIVLLPHERDLSEQEYIVDNDESHFTKGSYFESGKGWETVSKGFGYTKSLWKDNENPFRSGTSRLHLSSTKQNSEVRWTPAITKDETLAVYVSYQSFPNSVEDALYTVHHARGTSAFKVNQTMGGGTWIYLGSFPFEVGKSDQGVSLSNLSQDKGKVVSADAVKIGGGMGNIKRSMPATKVKRRRRWVKVPASPEVTSGLPRYAEAARYWMQWAGMPDSLYNGFKSQDDYTDDYKSRSVWVSYLTGGTPINPTKEGLNIPIDLSLTLHTDAGVREGIDDVVGTLAIFNTKWNQGLYPSGMDRLMARELTDIVQSYIVRDVRVSHNPDWKRRGMWDKNYSEATWGSVPGVLLELLSHQNFKDMCYGHDPLFKFTVARAIYKGILRYLSTEYDLPFVVHPLPVKQFAIDIDAESNRAYLSWHPTEDPTEPTAVPTHYILYTAIEGNNGYYDQGKIVKGNSTTVSIEPGRNYRFKVVAANAGGVSFDSEELSCGISPFPKGRVFVINGYDKVAEMEYNEVERLFAGIGTAITDRQDIAMPTDSGRPQVVKGNSFEYVNLHGKSLLSAGYSYGSASKSYIQSYPDVLENYNVVNLLLGKQKEKRSVHPTRPSRFAPFDEKIRLALDAFAFNGGGILVSGSYLNSVFAPEDLSSEADAVRTFARNTLGYDYPLPVNITEGSTIQTEHSDEQDRRTFVLTEGTECCPIFPAQGGGRVLHYTEGNISAGSFIKKGHRACVIGFPIENIKDDEDRAKFFKELIPLLMRR